MEHDWAFASQLRPYPICAMQLVINEISSSAPQALQAVKLLAQYQGSKLPKVRMGSAVAVRCMVAQQRPAGILASGDCTTETD